ncbi:hypothetical protein OG994_11350 [Micromonospora globbae]|uniref:Uncharacterized protein n=1 Tax=Micromonospora globbae TaxID=1894969 RepID=A0ABZ1SDJ1_9ACTN|nr:hypothetical protein [Micromonospora globbae]
MGGPPSYSRVRVFAEFVAEVAELGDRAVGQEVLCDRVVQVIGVLAVMCGGESAGDDAQAVHVVALQQRSAGGVGDGGVVAVEDQA